jgi:hypothetical protein
MADFIRPRVGLALLVALGTLGFGATSASANFLDTTTCQFNGVAGTVSPTIPAAPTVNPTQDGWYDFSGSATCVTTDNDSDPDATSTNPYAVTVVSEGNYTNIVVGTGEVAGSAQFGGPGAPKPDIGKTAPTLPYTNPIYPPARTNTLDWTTAGFGISFVNGVGELGGGAVGPGSDTTPPEVNPDGSSQLDVHELHGAVIITPKPLGSLPPVSAFDVNGGFVAS